MANSVHQKHEKGSVDLFFPKFFGEELVSKEHQMKEKQINIALTENDGLNANEMSIEIVFCKSTFIQKH